MQNYNNQQNISEIKKLEKKISVWDIKSCIVALATLAASGYMLYTSNIVYFPKNNLPRSVQLEQKRNANPAYVKMLDDFDTFQICLERLEKAESPNEFNFFKKKCDDYISKFQEFPENLKRDITELLEAREQEQKQGQEYKPLSVRPLNLLTGFLAFIAGMAGIDYCHKKTEKYEKTIQELMKSETIKSPGNLK